MNTNKKLKIKRNSSNNPRLDKDVLRKKAARLEPIQQQHRLEDLPLKASKTRSLQMQSIIIKFLNLSLRDFLKIH